MLTEAWYCRSLRDPSSPEVHRTPIRKSPFQRLVREITQRSKLDLCFQFLPSVLSRSPLRPSSSPSSKNRSLPHAH
ncbi:hypothetical protein K469DRAFT_294177 [Zopfia rhizophila CBS 207.26]|uniref:Uncharacterized protein n=1 Tax=Zopfia rhizophila CBS 207.26 TaxID=1314779 RepID=A0A6A6DKP2_9PEZI|nr:hypothetical protein K469DRAFT_294177 [Zopfia rhizophila CBS 207.26]